MQDAATKSVDDHVFGDRSFQSVRLDSGGLDDAGPELGLGLHERGELIWRTRRDDDSELAQLVRDRGIRPRLIRLRVELSDDLRGRFGRPDQAPPDGRLVTGETGLG